MAEFKLSIGDPKTGKTVKKVVSGEQADSLMKKKIGDKIKGDSLGFSGYEFQITGGSDYTGVPMRKDIDGVRRKRILVVSGTGIRKNRRGRRVRKNMAGNTVYSKTAQINLKVLKQGKESLLEEKKEEGKQKGASEEKPKPEAKQEEKKKADDKKSEPAKEEPKKEGKQEESEKEKKAEDKK